MDRVPADRVQSLFSQVDMYFQQKLVSSSTNYPYKAMMDVLLNFGQDATSTQLQTQLCYADTLVSMDHTDPTPYDQSKNAFCLMKGEKTMKYKVIITDVLLKVAMVGVSADLLRTHAPALQSKPAIYPLTKTDVKTFAIAKGQYNVNLDDIFQRRIPDRVVLGMTSSCAYVGHLEKNAFKFEHFNFEFM